MAKRFNLEFWIGKRHHSTIVWDKPYALCKGMKTQKEANHFGVGHYRITENK